MAEQIRADIAIIGTGPAGLEAAITAVVRNKKVLLFGQKDLSEKLAKAHEIRNYLGYPEVSGENLAGAFQKHLDAMGIQITEDRISAIYSMGDYYSLQGKTEFYEATSVILACGIVNGKSFPGENENLGRGVSYCATCDAALYKGKTAIVAAYSSKEEEEAAFLAEMADRVYYLPVYQETESLKSLEGNDKIQVVRDEKPVSIEKNAEGKMTLRCSSGAELSADGVFLLREAIAPDKLMPGLALEGNAVRCDRQMRTNLPGVFVCGDIAGAPYQYIKAAGEGNVAALSAVSYIAEVNRKAQQ